MKTVRLSIAFFLCTVVLVSSLPAAEFENGDFAKGKFRWEGDGDIGFLDKDGTIEPSDPSNDNPDTSSSTDPNTSDKVPILEIKLNRSNFKRIFQTFTTSEDVKHLDVTVVYKGSPGFLRNNKSPNYTLGISSEPNSSTISYEWIFPKVDMFIRLDRPDYYYGYGYYQLGEVKPGVEWQTLKLHCEEVMEKSQDVINIYAAPGEGSLYIKSVTISK